MLICSPVQISQMSYRGTQTLPAAYDTQWIIAILMQCMDPYPYWWGLWNLGQRLQSQKNKFTFFLKTSLVYLGTSPDTIGKISWPLKEAVLEASTFSLNLVKSDSKLLEALETSILIQYASVIPFRKALGVLMKLCLSWLTSEAIRGR